MGCSFSGDVESGRPALEPFGEGAAHNQPEGRQRERRWLGNLFHADAEREARLVGERVAAGNDRSHISLIVGIPAVQRDAVRGWKGFEPISLAGRQCGAADSS
jgi:hypothetical protein